MRRLLTFAIVGLVAQLIDGALGMAYGVTATSLLLTTGTSAAVASASIHLAEVGTTLVSGVSHWRFGNVSWRTVKWIGVPGALGAFAGATFLGSLDAAWLKPVIAAFLFGLGLYILARFAFGVLRRPVSPDHLRGRFLAPLGLFAGFLDAVGGGGWGPMTTPTLMTAGRMEPRTAIGSASASEFLVSVFASLGFLFALGSSGVDFGIVAALLVGGVIAAPLAAFAVRYLPAQVTGTLVGVLIIVTNLRTILLWAEVPGPERLAALVATAVVGLVLVARSIGRARAHAAEAIDDPTSGIDAARTGGAVGTDEGAGAVVAAAVAAGEQSTDGSADLPAPLDPLVEVRALRADGGVEPVSG